jgi:hypothetical protein
MGRPFITLNELSLEVPYSVDLWRAQDEYEWREVWFKKQPRILQRLPSFLSCVQDLELVREIADCVDIDLTIVTIVSATWSIISDYRRLDLVFQPSASDGNEPWHRNIHRIFDQLDTWHIPQEAFITRELLKMGLLVNMEHLHLFAGRDGVEEARRVYPLLKKWYAGRKSRQAIAHAGQVIRASNAAPFNRLRDFYAAGLYHSALCMWVYGICAIGSGEASPNNIHLNEKVWLDSEETSDIERFIESGHGTPWIRGLHERGVTLLNPKELMDTVFHGMEKVCCGGFGFVPPIVENLGVNMKDLGSAAWIVNNQSLRSTLPLPMHV